MGNRRLSIANIKDRTVIVGTPIAVALIFYYIVHNYFEYWPEPVKGMDICKMLIGMWSTLLGFLIAALSMLLALNNNNFIKMLRDTNHYGTVLFSYIVSSLYMLVAIIVAVYTVIFDLWTKRGFCGISAISLGVFVSLFFCIFFLFIIALRGGKGEQS